MRSRHISVVVAASPQRVYEFAAAPANLPAWAEGLTDSEVVTEGDVLHVSSPMGAVTVRFVARNEFGVLDHEVTLPDGRSVLNPMRVLAHPEGAEVLFTVRQLGLGDDEFDRDADRVAADLNRLKHLLEAPGTR